MACVFCDIVAKKTNTELLYEDEELVAFRDIKPAASFHFLIIPKIHKDNVKSITTDDKPMRKCFISLT
jgi:histidine triad (HIT) family protein